MTSLHSQEIFCVLVSFEIFCVLVNHTPSFTKANAMTLGWSLSRRCRSAGPGSGTYTVSG